MSRVFIAASQSTQRFALRLLLMDLNTEVVGEAADWSTILAQAPVAQAGMLVVDWDLLPKAPAVALKDLRKACPAALVIVLINRVNAIQQAAITASGADYIRKDERPDRLVELLRNAATRLPLAQ